MGEAINLVENFKVENVIFNVGEYNELENELITVLNKKKINYYKGLKELNINGQSFKANDIYQKLNLRSTFFDIKQKGKQVEITTKGYGHGVGMSQWGANAMAKNGNNYKEIIKHYFQGSDVININDVYLE